MMAAGPRRSSAPDKFLLATEATVAYDPNFRNTTSDTAWGNGEFYGMEILGDLNAFSIGFIDWNILLQQNGGPDYGDPTGEECEGIIECGSDAQLMVDLSVSPPVLYYQPFYYYMRHVSRFVPPGSVRLGSGFAPAAANLSVAAFATPAAGGSGASGAGTVLVAMNPTNATAALTVTDERYGVASTVMPPHSIQTWVY
jgi:glucosylceramidase